jgi:hypothetical protein
MVMRTMTADRALPHSNGTEISHWLTQVGVRLREASAAWVAHRRESKLLAAGQKPRDFVQADIAAFVGVVMRRD